MRLRLLLAAVVCAFASALRAADIPSPREAMPQVIDRYIDAAIAEAEVAPAAQADDATLVRRLTLDLVGRIPTASEVDAYVKSTDPDKRAKLVDRLMASPGVRPASGRAVRGDVQPRGESPRQPGAPRVPHDRDEGEQVRGTRSSAS